MKYWRQQNSQEFEGVSLNKFAR